MKTKPKSYTIATLCSSKKDIDTRPDYQRPPVWKTSQKQLLIDTILRNYDIPKIYMERIEAGKDKFEVVDGQQRLRAIWDFCEGNFPLAKDIGSIGDAEWKGKKYDQLGIDLKNKFDAYGVDIIIIEEAIKTDEFDEVRDMFLRLQNGTNLNEKEKRNAMTGKMRDFIKEIGEHKFFENCQVSNNRYGYDDFAAQLVCIEMEGGPVNIKSGDLRKMYEENIDFDTNGYQAKRVKKTLNYLLEAFPEKTPELQKHSVVTLYCLASRLLESYVPEGTEEMLAKWFIEFENERREDEVRDEENKNPELIEYKNYIRNSSTTKSSIEHRLRLFSTRFFQTCPDIPLKDDNRLFSDEQRLAIFRRDDRKCQLKITCSGEQKLNWGNWHADHIVPHSKAGQTIVSNGQVACPVCNMAKGNKTE